MANRFERFTLDIFQISHAWNKLATEEMKEHGLKGVCALYLLTMLEYPQGITIAKLAEVCGRDKADVSRSVTRMENQGLVKRSAEHQYRIPIYLTDAGKTVVEMINQRASLALNLAGQGLDDEKRKNMYECLELIADNMSQLVREGIPKEE